MKRVSQPLRPDLDTRDDSARYGSSLTPPRHGNSLKRLTLPVVFALSKRRVVLASTVATVCAACWWSPRRRLRQCRSLPHQCEHLGSAIVTVTPDQVRVLGPVLAGSTAARDGADDTDLCGHAGGLAPGARTCGTKRPRRRTDEVESRIPS